MLNSLPIIYR